MSATRQEAIPYLLHEPISGYVVAVRTSLADIFHRRLMLPHFSLHDKLIRLCNHVAILYSLGHALHGIHKIEILISYDDLKNIIWRCIKT